MALAIFLSMMAGAFGVWQAGMNKVVADSLGFTASLLFNGVFFLVFNGLFFLIVWGRPSAFPSEFAIRLAFEDFKWWWLLPGLMGFALVMGLAVSVGRIGAVQTIVISVAAQVFASIIWDMWDGDFQLNQWRLIGAGLTLVGAVIATLS
jgi:bacterial/archaeal transporter family-2 protein